jgi:hypothetical protein
VVNEKSRQKRGKSRKNWQNGLALTSELRYGFEIFDPGVNAEMSTGGSVRGMSK